MRLVVIAQDELEALIARALEPLRLELQRLRSAAGPSLVRFPEAARVLGLSLRSVQRRARDGRIEVELVGGVRMVKLPPGACAAVSEETLGSR